MLRPPCESLGYPTAVQILGQIVRGNIQNRTGREEVSGSFSRHSFMRLWSNSVAHLPSEAAFIISTKVETPPALRQIPLNTSGNRISSVLHAWRVHSDGYNEQEEPEGL